MSKEPAKEMPKIKLLDLPRSLLRQMLLYLNAKELHYPLMEANRLFHELANDPEVVTAVFFGQLRVPLRYGGAEFAALRPEERSGMIKDIVWQSGINEKLNAVAYFTDGGISSDDSKFFISNIYTDNPSYLHSTKRGENVHIKAVCSEGIAQGIDNSDIAKYKVPEKKAKLYAHPADTYVCPVKSLLSKHDPQNSHQFAVMKYHDLNRNLSGYTCFLQSFAVFISMEEIDVEHPLVQLFNGVKKIEQVEQLGLDFMSLQSTEDTKVVEFSLASPRKLEETLQKHVPGAKLDGVYPFIWGDISAGTTNYLNVVQRIGFRYMLLKLIDSHKTQGDANIDCYSVALSGNHIKLRFSNEE